MSGKTRIEWATDSWNPLRGCSKVSPGCKHCFAERMAARFCRPGEPFHGFVSVASAVSGLRYENPSAAGVWEKPHWTSRVELIESQLEIPLHWRKPRRIFVNSMSDTFHEALPDEAIDQIFAVMALCQQHTFMALTKRPERMREYISGSLLQGGMKGRLEWIQERATQWSHDSDVTGWPLPNVWLGISCEDRAHKDRIDYLRETPAALRFLSLEPLLEDLGALDLRGIGWVIAGGESGPGARPCNVAWIRSVVRQCRAAGVACFVKQLGARPRGPEQSVPDWVDALDGKGGNWECWPADLRVREMPEVPR